MPTTSMPATSMPANLTTATLTSHKIGELDTLTITGKGYCAVVLLQGAQLIYFSTDHHHCTGSVDPLNLSNLLNPINGVNHTTENTKENIENMPDNWLWVSEQADYKKGISVRGGVPICWPVFGMFDANPQSVKDSFQDCAYDITQHGYADTQPFELVSFEDDITSDTQATTQTKTHNNGALLILKLIQSDNNKLDNMQPSDLLELTVKFRFSQQGFSITLITQNNSSDTIHFSQALHTYLPTPDITQTYIKGFDKITYSDALTVDANTGGWHTKTQHGDITFENEVDRVYHAAPEITLTTASKTYQLHAQGSNSTVIWNPWVEKSKQISQFADDDYQHMLCIETANAHLDAVTLGAGEAWEMGVRVVRRKSAIYK